MEGKHSHNVAVTCRTSSIPLLPGTSLLADTPINETSNPSFAIYHSQDHGSACSTLLQRLPAARRGYFLGGLEIYQPLLGSVMLHCPRGVPPKSPKPLRWASPHFTALFCPCSYHGVPSPAMMLLPFERLRLCNRSHPKTSRPCLPEPPLVGLGPTSSSPCAEDYPSLHRTWISS